MSTAPWQVLIHEQGRSGTIEYREGERSLSLDWEFGGTTVVAIIYTHASEWDTKFSWAARRRVEILTRIGAEVVRQKASGCVAESDATNAEWMYIRSPTETAQG